MIALARAHRQCKFIIHFFNTCLYICVRELKLCRAQTQTYTNTHIVHYDAHIITINQNCIVY